MDAEGSQQPAPGGVALVLIDVINAMDFEGAEALHRPALAAAEAIRGLRDEADALGVPVVYVNDNYGHWGSEKAAIVAFCRGRTKAGQAVVDRLAPREGDYFVIKPSFSGFYATNLPVLLPWLGATRLVLAGFAADICVLFTAGDAHMREYALWVPSDGVASESPDRHGWALSIMRNSMGAETRNTQQLRLAEWISAQKKPPAFLQAASACSGCGDRI